MKIKKSFLMAALALTFAACSNDDNEIQLPDQPAQAEGITITAKLAPKGADAATRAVYEGTNEIVAGWANDEQIAILYEVSGTKKNAIATIKSVDASGTATIEFTVDGSTTDGTACTLVYPATAAKKDASGVKDAYTLLAYQNGKLTANHDVRVGEGTIQTSTPSLYVTKQPEAQFAIFKFTVKEAGSESLIKVGGLTININGLDYNIAYNLGSELEFPSTLYAALPATSNQTVSFSAVKYDGKKSYTCSKDNVSFEKGYYYQSTLKMNPAPTLNLTDPKVGQVICSDGKNYDVGSVPAGVTKVAMIGRVSTDIYVSSMAISLTGNTRQMSAFEASEIAKCTTPVFTGGYWDLGWGWKGAFLACRVDGDATEASDDMSPIYGFKAKIEAAGYSWPSGRYWIGTDLGEEMTINLNGGNARATFKVNTIWDEEEIGTAGYIPCLYF